MTMRRLQGTFRLMMMISVLAPAATAAQQPATHVDSDVASLRTALDEHMSRLVPFGFHGNLLVVKDGQTVLRAGYGKADLEIGRPFTPQTPIYIGSLTKQFTAAAILKLEMEGRLRVTDSIARFLPDVPADKRGITLHHLLTHTSGLAMNAPAGLGAVRGREALEGEILGAPLQRPVGAGYSYSNAGYALLAAVVERVAGVPYERYLRETLWVPAGMTGTGYRPDGMEAVAVGYSGGTRWGTPMEHHAFDDGPTWSMRGAGGMISTLDDLHRWHRALNDGQVLSAEAKAKLWTPHVAENASGTSHYGYGWMISQTTRGTRLVRHNGSNLIYYAEIRWYPDDDVLIVVATNVAEASGNDALTGIVRLTFGTPYTAPPIALPADPARAAAAAGRYRLSGGGTVIARNVNGRLEIESEGQDAYAALRGSAPSPELEETGRRTMLIVDAANRDDFGPMHQAFGGRMSTEDLSRIYRGNLAAMGLGAVESMAHVGTRAQDGGALSVVRVQFERGQILLGVIWEGGGLDGMEVVQEADGAVFMPAPDNGWVRYDFGSGDTLRMRVMEGVMEIETPAEPVRAVRH